MTLAGGKLSIIVDVKIGQNELKSLQSSIDSMFKDRNMKLGDSAIKNMTSQLESFRKRANKPINIKINSSKATGELKKLESRFKSLRNVLDGTSATKGGLGKGFMSGINAMSSGMKRSMLSAELDIKTATNNIQRSMNSLKPIGKAGDMLSGIKASEAALRGLTSASGKAASGTKAFASGQAAAYKKLESSVKGYYKALERMDKFQDRVDKNVATKSDIGNLASAKKQVEQLGSAMKKLESSFKTGDNQKFFDKNLDRGVKNLKEMSSEARKMQQEINSAGNEARQLESAYDHLVKTQKEINRLSKQEVNAGDAESAVIREQIGLLERKSKAIRETNNLSRKGNSVREDEIRGLRETGALERRRAESKITDRASRTGSSRGQGYKSVFGMDRMYGYIDVIDLMREGTRVVRSQFEQFRELDTALTSVKKVANATDSQWKDFNDTLYDNASAVGKTATEYGKSVERWAAAGYDLEKATEYGMLSTMGAFVGNIDEEAMVKYMSVPLNAFKDSVDATDILNVMNEVSNNTAAEMSHLGEAYSRAAATAAQSGTSFEELTAIIATTQEATRLGGEVIGTTWRTMDKNVAEMASQSTGSQKKKYNMFKDWGVDLLDANGELKSTYDVLKDVRGIWDDLSSVEQTTAATAIGGARGLAMIQSVMANWDRVQDILGMSQGQMGLGKAGSAYEEFEIQSESMEYKIATLKNTWQEFMNSLMGGDASGVFKGALDGMTGLVENLQSIAENESAMGVIKGLGKAAAELLAIDLVGSGFSKLFGENGFVGKMGGSLKHMTSGFKEATGGLKGIDKLFTGIGGAMVSGGWAALPGKLMLVHAGFKAVDWAVGELTGKNIGGWVKSWADPFSDGIEAFSDSVTKANETIAKNNHTIEAIDDYKEMAGAYRDMQAERIALFEATGDVSKLSMPDDEFSQLKESHNALVEQLGLPLEMKIEFNGYDHVNQQMDALEGRLQKVKAEAIAENIGAMEDAYSTYSDLWDTAREIVGSAGDVPGTDRATSRKMSKMTPDELNKYRDSLNIPAEDWDVMTQGAEEYARAIDGISKVFRGEEYSEAHKELRNMGREFDKLVDTAISSDNPLDNLRRMFDNPEYEFAQPMAFMKAFQGVMKEQKKVQELSDEAGTMGQLIDKALSGGDAKDIAPAILKAKEMASALEETATMKEFMEDSLKDGMSLDDMLQAAFEGDGDALGMLSKYREAVQKAVQETSDGFMESKKALTGFADAMGMTSDQVEGLMDAYDEGRMGDIAKAFFDTNAEMAAIAYNMSKDTHAALAQMSFDKFGNMDQIGDVVKGITDQINTLPKEVISSFQLVDETTGEMDYDRIIQDLEQYDGTEFLAQIGVQMDDGTFDNVGNFYLAMQELDNLSDSQTKEISTKFDMETVDIQSIMDGIESGEITIDIVVDEEGNLEKLELVKEQDGETVTVDVMAEYEMDESAEGIHEMLEEQESVDKIVDVNIKPEYNEGDVQSEGHIERLFGLANETIESTIDVETGVNHILTDDGSADVGRLTDVINAKMESQEFVTELNAKLDLNLETGDTINLSDLSDALDGKFPQDYEKQLNLLVELLPEVFGIGEVEQGVSDGLEGIEEQEAEVPVDVTADPNVDEFANAIDESVSEASADDVGPVDVNAIVNIALEENIIQDNLSGIASILSEDYDIQIGVDVEDGGLEQVTGALRELPSEQQIRVLAQALGLESVNEMSETLEGIPPETVVSAILQATGTETLQEGLAALEGFDGKRAAAEAITRYSTEGEEPEPPTDAEATHTTYVEFAVTNPEAIAALDGQDISFTVTANLVDNASAGIQSINSALQSMPSSKSISISVASSGTAEVEAVQASLGMIDGMTTTAMIDGDAGGFHSAAGSVEGWSPPSFTVSINADASGFWGVVNSLSVPASFSTTIHARVERSGSATIGADIGASFSSSIGSALGLDSLSGQQINRSQSKTKEDKVNEDVWRYWAKEMYDGDKLENSMSKLTDAINRAGDDYAKIINLSRQQISLAKDQMRFEREMVGLEQQHMNSILSELRGYGFRNEGNKITNLGHAQSLSGDTAKDAETALNTWRDLHKSITGLNVRISDLQGTIHRAEEAIKDARLSIELEKLEKRLAKTELLLSSVSNNLTILNDKDSFIGSEDYEFKIRVSEENIDASIYNVRELMDEFNRLSVMSLEFEDNYENVLRTLEELSESILENADNIIRFREQITSIRIDSLQDDFDRFSDAVDRNSDSVNKNINLLKEGLMDAYGTDELSGAYTVDYTRKTALEREYEDRLMLAERLDTALENFAKKNVQRTHSATEAQLRIAKSGYRELFKIQQGIHSAGIGNYSSYMDFGARGVSSARSDFTRRQAELLKHLNQYQAAYNGQIRQYEQALRAAATTRDREIAQYDMIIAQLSLQEEYQNKVMENYRSAIRLAEAEIAKGSITTEQKRDLLEFIEDYRDKIKDAQEVIRKAIGARFEYEFDMMDRAADKAESYYDNISHLLDVGKMINLSPDAMKPFFNAVYRASTYQHALAEEHLRQLNAQQKDFAEGSYEWNLLAKQIDSVRKSMRDLTIQSLESNQAIMENTMNSLERMLEIGLLDGKTLSQWKDFNEEWVSGIEKEVTLEGLRRKALDAESQVIKDRLNMLDRQDDVSRADLDYLDKQLKVLELEGKLRNIENERSIQVLGRRADGTWGFDYAADQTEYDKTRDELDEAKVDLEQFITEHRTSYVERLGEVIEKAKKGGYDDTSEIQSDLNLLNLAYGMVLSDIPGFKGMSFDEILSTYQEYLSNNNIITDGLVSSGVGSIDNTIAGTGLTPIQQELVGMTTQLGEIIGSELRRALGDVNSDGFKGAQIYQIGELVLPNVTDGDGLANIFNDLPKAAEQAIYDKTN